MASLKPSFAARLSLLTGLIGAMMILTSCEDREMLTLAPADEADRALVFSLIQTDFGLPTGGVNMAEIVVLSAWADLNGDDRQEIFFALQGAPIGLCAPDGNCAIWAAQLQPDAHWRIIFSGAGAGTGIETIRSDSDWKDIVLEVQRGEVLTPVSWRHDANSGQYQAQP